MESWCRICSRSDEFRRFPLFSVADVCQEVIAKMITSCTDTQVSSEDGLPQQICPDCLITLSLAYSFRRLCRRTDAKFRETFDPRAPSHSAEHMATASGGGSQPRRSQSQVGDEAGGVVYDSVPVIKEEVEFYDYECSAPPPPEDQWVIQDPRTIHEGAAAAMTVLHNAGPYQEDGGGGGGDGQPEVDDMMSSMVPMVTMEEGGGVGGHDPAEYGESSGAGQKKKRHEPERFSKRIRRQSHTSDPILHQPIQITYPAKKVGEKGSGSSSNNVDGPAELQPINTPCCHVNVLARRLDQMDTKFEKFGHISSKIDRVLQFAADVYNFMAVRSQEELHPRSKEELHPRSEEDFSECEKIAIKDKNDLIKLEERLKDFEFAEKLLRYYQSVFNLSGKRDGKDFFRKFMRQTVPPSILVGYSWTGQTRAKKEGNLPNQSFQLAFPDFIQFTRKLMKKADCTSTDESTNSAFAGFLRQKKTEIRRFGSKTPRESTVDNVTARQSETESSAGSSDEDEFPGITLKQE